MFADAVAGCRRMSQDVAGCRRTMGPWILGVFPADDEAKTLPSCAVLKSKCSVEKCFRSVK